MVQEDQEPDSDVLAVEEGYISITPISLDLTDYKLMEEYRQTFARYLDFFSREIKHDRGELNNQYGPVFIVLNLGYRRRRQNPGYPEKPFHQLYLFP